MYPEFMDIIDIIATSLLFLIPGITAIILFYPFKNKVSIERYLKEDYNDYEDFVKLAEEEEIYQRELREKKQEKQLLEIKKAQKLYERAMKKSRRKILKKLFTT